MESYGELLKKTREQKFITIDSAVRETSIKREYILGLEAEDSSAFPGEAYLIGFLKNYSKYLGVPSETVLALYHSKELQEAPVPEGLIVKQRPTWVVPLIIAGSVFGLALICFLMWLIFLRGGNDVDGSIVNGPPAAKEYDLSDDKIFHDRIYKGDKFKVLTSSMRARATEATGASDKDKTFVIVKSTMKDKVVFETPAGDLYAYLSEEIDLDIDGDGIKDLIVWVSDISERDDSKGANVTLLQKKGDAAEPSQIRLSVQETSEQQTEKLQTQEYVIADAVKGKPPKVLIDDNRAYPFSIEANFRASCIFRHKADAGDSKELALEKGASVSIPNAKNGVRMWISNANAATFSLKADIHSLTINPREDFNVVAGQVLVLDVKWIFDGGRYKLVVQELN